MNFKDPDLHLITNNQTNKQKNHYTTLLVIEKNVFGFFISGKSCIVLKKQLSYSHTESSYVSLLTFTKCTNFGKVLWAKKNIYIILFSPSIVTVFKPVIPILALV